MTEKQLFVRGMKEKTKKFAVDTIKFCDSLKTDRATAVISYQLIKSSTSVGANYRASCRARSKKEFFSKICIVVEEADESIYWLEVIKECNLSKQSSTLEKLTSEANEITRIMAKAKDSMARH